MTAEMPRDDTIARLKQPIVTKLDLLKALHHTMPDQIERRTPSAQYTLTMTLKGTKFSAQYTKDEIEVGLAYLRISKQL